MDSRFDIFSDGMMSRCWYIRLICENEMMSLFWCIRLICEDEARGIISFVVSFANFVILVIWRVYSVMLFFTIYYGSD